MNEEPLANTTNRETDKLRRHDYQPLVHKAVRLVVVHALYGNDVRLFKQNKINIASIVLMICMHVPRKLTAHQHQP